MMEKTTKMAKKGLPKGNGRGILTPLERQKLENGTVDRHSRYNIEAKTRKAVDDLSLILTTNPKPFDVRPFVDVTSGYDLDALDSYIQDLILIQYRSHYQRLVMQRTANGTKRKVSSKQVWKIVNRTIKEAKKNIRAEVLE